jgi:hypothetical protein
MQQFKNYKLFVSSEPFPAGHLLVANRTGPQSPNGKRDQNKYEDQHEHQEENNASY